MVGFTVSKDSSTTWPFRSKPAEYSPLSTLRFAHTMGAVPSEILDLPLELVYQLYPGFEREGLPALLIEYADEYALKADASLILSADEVAVMKRAAPGWMFKPFIEEDEAECAAGFYVKQIILAWPRCVDVPPRVPLAARGNGGYLVPLIDAAPVKFRECLPPHVRTWWYSKKTPGVSMNMNRTAWSTTVSTSTRTYK